MSLIQAGQLQLKRTDESPSSAKSPAAPPRKPLPYLGAVGTIPLSVPTGTIHHHPGATPSSPGKAA
ncbi:MAG TPA: hypothetical protein VHA57_11625 [Actinomycetota bacterium]|nr:hypothetical protein [Actinomycetota bacterium]